MQPRHLRALCRSNPGQDSFVSVSGCLLMHRVVLMHALARTGRLFGTGLSTNGICAFCPNVVLSWRAWCNAGSQVRANAKGPQSKRALMDYEPLSRYDRMRSYCNERLHGGFGYFSHSPKSTALPCFRQVRYSAEAVNSTSVEELMAVSQES